MGRAVIYQRDQHRSCGWQQLAIELDASNTAANPVRILDLDDVSCRAISENDFEMPPGFWDAGVNNHRRATPTKPEYPFETRPIHPSGGTGVPGPAATPDMSRLGIDIAAGNVRFNLIAMDAGTCAGVIDGIQKGKQFAGLVPFTEHCEGDHRPDGAMGVLAAVLANPARVTSDIARIGRRMIEGRS